MPVPTWLTVGSTLVPFVCFLSVCTDLLPDSASPTREVTQLLLRALLVPTLFAFRSLQLQAKGLSGLCGLSPLATTKKKIAQWRLITQERIQASFGSLDTSNVIATLPNLLASWLADMLAGVTLYMTQDADDIGQIATTCLKFTVLGALVYPGPPLFAFLFLGYYSCKRTLPDFFNLQWDALLLECLFYATLLSLADLLSHALLINMSLALFKILLFRLMFGSGVVKLCSPDNTWNDCTAMYDHFLTQPLPGRLAKALHQLPRWVLRAMSFQALYIAEILIPLLQLVPAHYYPPLPAIVAVSYATLHISITIGGHYGFFNGLSAVLGLALLDDNHLAAVHLRVPSLLSLLGVSKGDEVGGRLTAQLFGSSLVSTMLVNVGVVGLGAVCVACLLANFSALYLILDRNGDFGEEDPSSSPRPSSSWSTCLLRACKWCQQLQQQVPAQLLSWVHSPLQLLSVGCHYGLFATVTKYRDELVVEVSDDFSERLQSADFHCAQLEATWTPIEFKYKPGSADPVGYKPMDYFMHMPRFDWSLWFVPLHPRVQTFAKGVDALCTDADKKRNMKEGVDTSAHRQQSIAMMHKVCKEVGAILPQWFTAFLCGLLEREPSVLSLLHSQQAPGVLEKDDIKAVTKMKEGRSGIEIGNDREQQEKEKKMRMLRSLIASKRNMFYDSEAEDIPKNVLKELEDSLASSQMDSSERCVRVRLVRYNFAPHGSSDLWAKSMSRLLLPPCALSMLYEILDSKGTPRSLRAVPDKYKPETAAQIIQKTFFRKKE